VKATRRRKYPLKELLRKITAKNIHAEVDTGDPVGREVW
jgi:antitoxin component of MazEF toxin-antitoxin module